MKMYDIGYEGLTANEIAEMMVQDFGTDFCHNEFCIYTSSEEANSDFESYKADQMGLGVLGLSHFDKKRKIVVYEIDIAVKEF
jgi:hypothetical protein